MLQFVQPALEVGQSIQIDSGPFMDADPGPTGDVGNGKFPGKVFTFFETRIQHLVEPPCFTLVALDRVFDGFRRIPKLDRAPEVRFYEASYPEGWCCGDRRGL